MSSHELRKIAIERGQVLDYLVQCERCKAEIIVAWTNPGVSEKIIQKAWEKAQFNIEWATRSIQEGPSCNENLTKRVLEE